MKKWLFIFGTSSLMLISLSLLFKTIDWEGAGLLMVFGVLLLALVLIATAILTRLVISFIAAFSMIFILLSLGFRVVHLPGEQILLIIGAVLFSLVFLPMLGWMIYQQSDKGKKD